jgi:hypothetical protein
MSAITVRKLRSVLKKRFGGVIKKGSHEENGQCCALELLSVCREIPWTDNPGKVGSWDLRDINDIPVLDDLRTKHLVPVIAAYADSMSWPKERQREVATKLVILTVNRIVAELPGLSDAIRNQCREAKTLAAASAAASAAAGAAASDARYAASAASAAGAARYAASAASAAAGAAAGDAVFIVACKLWLDAAV